MGETTAMTLASLITDMTSIMTAELAWVGQVLETIEGSPILLFAVVGGFALIAVGIVRRLIQL